MATPIACFTMNRRLVTTRDCFFFFPCCLCVCMGKGLSSCLSNISKCFVRFRARGKKKEKSLSIAITYVQFSSLSRAWVSTTSS